jgi:hypothetical protein
LFFNFNETTHLFNKLSISSSLAKFQFKLNTGAVLSIDGIITLDGSKNVLKGKPRGFDFELPRIHFL